MSDKTPFQEWWERIGGRNLNDPKTEDMAHRAWIAALEHARELMREEETE